MDHRLTADLSAARRRAVRIGLGAMHLAVLVVAVGAVAGIGGDALGGTAQAVAYPVAAALVLARVVWVRESRAAWGLVAIGMGLCMLGQVVWFVFYEGSSQPATASLADPLWLSLQPFVAAGLFVLARPRRRVPNGVRLDGIVAALGVCAIGAMIVLGPVSESDMDGLDMVVNAAYPAGDVLLLAVIVGVLAVRGWRIDRLWALIAVGVVGVLVAEVVYLLQVTTGQTTRSMFVTVVWMAGMALVAHAAWTRPAPVPVDDAGGRLLLVPSVFALAALALLTVDHFGQVEAPVFVFSVLTLVAVLARAAIAYGDLRTLAVRRREALTDDLTGLANRRALMRNLEHMLAVREDGSGGSGGGPMSIALLLIDLDNFKELNDTLGHHAGDEVLRGVGPRMRAALGREGVLGRLGGDEFGVVLTGLDEDGALLVAQRVRHAIEQPFEVQGMRLRGAASVGIALAPQHGDTAEALLARADVAMYEAKRLRTGQRVYAFEADTHSRDALALAGDLPAAIAAGEVEAFFQPQADASTGRIVGVEALVRWRHPERGVLAPPAFVPLAEQTGVGRALTRCVLEQALDALATWRAEGYDDLRVSVNTTVSDLLDTSFPGEVAAALDAAGLPADALVLEVTESSILADRERIDAVLAGLRSLGCKLSLDDFGTGYSSLAHLKDLAVDEIKIDRSFVLPMREDRVSAAIVEATISLATRLGVTATAEGVEDDATWDALLAAGADVVQGYRLSRPVPAADLTALLASPSTRYPVSASAK